MSWCDETNVTTTTTTTTKLKPYKFNFDVDNIDVLKYFFGGNYKTTEHRLIYDIHYTPQAYFVVNKNRKRYNIEVIMLSCKPHSFDGKPAITIKKNGIMVGVFYMTFGKLDNPSADINALSIADGDKDETASFIKGKLQSSNEKTPAYTAYIREEQYDEENGEYYPYHTERTIKVFMPPPDDGKPNYFEYFEENYSKYEHVSRREDFKLF
jgi:hypothetical protein